MSNARPGSPGLAKSASPTTSAWRTVALTGVLVVLRIALGEPACAQELRIEPRQFKLGSVTVEAQTGFLVVPECRSRAESRTIQIAFAQLKSRAQTPRAPLFYLAGGPGAPATPLVEDERWLPFLEHSDVVLLDQRGCGRSTPNLAFETGEFHPERWFMDAPTALEHALEIAARAAEHFAAEGVDLACYQTRESAADVDALRRALCFPVMALLGHSYGTHLGLEVVRSFGANVERFVSVGTSGMNDMHQLPADLDARLKRLSDVIAADHNIGKQMPDFFGEVVKALDQLDAEPFRCEVTRADGRKLSIEVGPQGLQWILLRDLGDTADLPVLPRLVASIRRGETAMFRWFLEKRVREYQAFPTLLLVNRSSSGATTERWEQILEQADHGVFGRIRTMFAPEIEAELGVRDLGDDYRKPVQSDVPALFISGTLDANTPPEMAEAVRKGFSRSAHLIVENGGHENLLEPPEVLQRLQEFLAGKEVKDARFKTPPVRFAPLSGPTIGFDHPALRAR